MKSKVSGYASLYNIKDLGNDMILPGAFNFDRHGVKMLFQHKSDQIVGTDWEITSDDKGLFVSGNILEDLPLGKVVKTLVDSKALTGLSIGYKIMPGGFTYDKETDIRKLTNIKLFEVSFVTFPMLEDARLGNQVKSIPDDYEGLRYKMTDGPIEILENVAAGTALWRGLERHLRDVGGHSKTEAQRIVSEMKQNPNAFSQIKTALAVVKPHVTPPSFDFSAFDEFLVRNK